MKMFAKEFFKRGLVAAAGGPVVLAIVYAILGARGVISTLSVQAVCTGILTVTLLAFIAAGSGAVYKVERLSVFAAALIQGALLYCDYLLIYLLNGWLKSQAVPVAIFSGCFVAGYLIIWLIVYNVTKKSTDKLNSQLNA
ncbi:MAG: DUF3021 domain-containing protein [Clostridia bacterium]|nr:DUF3021 domain-containing protein [Clostridia bacterium]